MCIWYDLQWFWASLGCLLLFMHGCMKFLQNIMYFGLVNLEIERFGGIEDFKQGGFSFCMVSQMNSRLRYCW